MFPYGCLTFWPEFLGEMSSSYKILVKYSCQQIYVDVDSNGGLIECNFYLLMLTNSQLVLSGIDFYDLALCKYEMSISLLL